MKKYHKHHYLILQSNNFSTILINNSYHPNTRSKVWTDIVNGSVPSLAVNMTRNNMFDGMTFVFTNEKQVRFKK